LEAWCVWTVPGLTCTHHTLTPSFCIFSATQNDDKYGKYDDKYGYDKYSSYDKYGKVRVGLVF
jgi:hypothetical protein